MSKNIFDINIASGFKPNADNDFPLLRAKDVEVREDGERLDNYIPIIITQDQYNALVAGEEVTIILNDGSEKIITHDENKIYFIKKTSSIPVDPDPIIH